MNTERVLEVVAVLRKELEEHRLYEPLDRLSKQLAEGSSQGIQVAKDELIGLLSKVPSNNFTPSRRAILRQLGGERLVGQGLADRLSALLEDYRLVPAEAAKVVTGIHGEILSFNGHLNNLGNSARSLHLAPNVIPRGKCEIGVLYPRPEVIVDLESLVEESRDLDTALRVFMEIGGSPGSPRISQVSSSDLAFYLTVIPAVGLALVKCIEKTLEFIHKKYEIDKIRLEIEEKKIDLEMAKQLKERAKKVEEEGIKEAGQIILSLYEGADEGRRNELRGPIKTAPGGTPGPPLFTRKPGPTALLREKAVGFAPALRGFDRDS